MDNSLKECFEKNRLVEFPQAKTFVARELKEAEDDLRSAKESVKTENYKWATIQAYYTMFHCARSLVYKLGYREKNHFCLISALKAFYLDKGLIEHKVIEDIQLGKRMREGADYHADFSKEGAEALIKSAEKFLPVAYTIVNK
ncbi:MAG: HEPN domain-containing protein [bacterium]|nr:HEPN domain-containing protein [bacterium]